MAQVTHKVIDGDTLSELAVRYGTTVSELCKLNNISDPDLIYAGETLIISGSPVTVKTNTTQRAVIERFGIQSGTERTLFAQWSWNSDKNPTEKYQVRWYYATGDGIWFIGSDTTVTFKHATYTAPENAYKVGFFVKPISKTKKENGKDTVYFNSDWTDRKDYFFSEKAYPPDDPTSAPSVSVDKYYLDIKLENLNTNATHVVFAIVQNDTKQIHASKYIKLNYGSASYRYRVAPGNKYKVRYRAYKNTMLSEWSPFSGNVSTVPSAPDSITVLKATSKTSIYIEWPLTNDTKSYDIEYTTKLTYFDDSNRTTVVSGIETNHYHLGGLETGQEYFFRVRSVNSVGNSDWMPASKAKSIIIGKAPAAPTTWSSTTTAIVGEPLNLYWVHNTEDGSSQTYAELELYIGDIKEEYVIKNSTDEDEKDKTSVYSIDTSEYPEGTKIEWRVRTSGITNELGEWSVQRSIDIYAPPSLELDLIDGEGNGITTVTSFPVYVHALAGPNTQMPISYHLSVKAEQSYDTVDNLGNEKTINAGDEVYSKHFDISDPLVVELSANNINLDNGISYSVSCLVSMNSGLTTEGSVDFDVSWTDDEYWPNAEITVDDESYSAMIRPYCYDENGELLEGVKLAVYRREFDGTFTEIASGMDNTQNTCVTDPHPSLDYARYRVTATSDATGAVSFYDIPGYPVGCKCAIIQWDEEWSNFDVSNELEMAEPVWGGSMLKLPYNLDVNDVNRPDVTLVKYIGQEHPISYYGTQVGSSSSWNLEIEKTDKETLYGLRRLARWMDDVYIREPSGNGYWANISVSFGIKHLSLTIPVNITITRVKGGV